jgi:hypothetical protein
MVSVRAAFMRAGTLAVLTAAGCGGHRSSASDDSRSLPACGDGAFFSVAPVAPGDYVGLTPLGHLAPSGHTFPTDHMYFYTRPGTVVPVVSPGNVTVVVAALMQASGGQTDYQLYFQPCRDYTAYYDHVTTLSDSLAKQIGGFDDATCSTYGDPARPFRRCAKDVSIHVGVGQTIGTAGIATGLAALDLGAMDGRVPPLDYANPARIQRDDRYGVDRLHVVCPLDAYEPAVREALLARVSDYQGTPRRREPMCGEVMQDIKGAAKGNWYLLGTPTSMPYPEDPHLALADDNDFNTDRQVFSVGTSMRKSGLSPGPYFFRPATTGSLNREWKGVTPGGTYCYDAFDPKPFPAIVLLVQMPTATTLRMERITAASCQAALPWTFSSRATEFER